MESYVLGDGEQFTVCTETGDHRFETVTEEYDENTRLTVYYEETHLDGSFEVLDDGPIESVWETLFGSDTFLTLMKQQSIDTIRRGS